MGGRHTAHESRSGRPALSANAGGTALGCNSRCRKLGDRERSRDRGLARDDAHADEKVVAVVHGGVIGHILAHATGASPFAFNGADNGSITRIVMHETGIKVRSFNDNLHVRSTLHAGSGQLT